MKTILKVLAGIVLIIVVLMSAAAVYVKFFFDPNDLRAKITKVVKERSGRDLVIEGDFSVSTFPWLGVNVGRTSLSDDAAFKNDTLLAFESASASIKLMPLLKKQVELGRTTINGANLTLIRFADGTSNWNAFIDSFGSDQTADKTASSADSGFMTQTLGAITVEDATIRFDDKSLGQDLRFSQFNLTTDEVKPGEAFQFKLATQIDADEVNLKVDFDGKLLLDATHLSVEKPVLKVSGKHFSVPFGNFDATVTGDVMAVKDSEAVLTAPEVKWSAQQGNDAAESVKSVSGTLTGKSVSSVNDNIQVETPVVNFDATLNNDPVNTVKGTLTAGAIVLEGENTQVKSPNLVFDATFNNDPLKSMKGTFTGTTLSRVGSNTQIKTPDLTFDSQLKNDTVTDMKGRLRGDTLSVKNDAQMTLPAPVLAMTASGPGLPNKTQELAVSGRQLMVNLDTEKMNLDGYQAKAMGMDLKGDLAVTAIFGDLSAQSAVSFSPLNLRELLKKLDIEMDTSNKAALSKFSGKGDVFYRPTSMGMKNMDVTLDSSKITGEVAIVNNARQAVVNIDQINVDHYLPPPDAAAGDKGREIDAIEVPAQAIRELNLNGHFKVGSMTFGGIESKNVEVKIVADKGQVRVNPARAQVYGGTYSGDVRVDASGEVPVMSLNESFDNVDIGALGQDMAGTSQVKGRITGKLAMTARGHNTRDLKASSNGTAEFSIKDGVLEGVNVMETVRNIVALANKEAVKPDEPDRTEFRRLSGTAKITNGVLANDDLIIEMPLMRVSGSGRVDVNTKAIDYKIGAKVVQEGDIPLEKELRFLSDYTLPLFVSGTYDAPVVDKGRSVADLIKQFATKRVKDELFGRIFGKDKETTPTPTTGANPSVTDASKTTAEAAPVPLTPEQQAKKKEEELKDKVDDKVKNALKGLFGD